ncbi:uncharacterized protein LOC118644670 [Monomorium pharaonis]|uniref:uncharacterized protein LOC118644670 n=1 Tax=Monomorium pharaonis TaxID=307658 RepID=UPI00063F0148|nr:uncharacterized protein LOC118644670 [Monomorium pharaonis]
MIVTKSQIIIESILNCLKMLAIAGHIMISGDQSLILIAKAPPYRYLRRAPLELPTCDVTIDHSSPCRAFVPVESDAGAVISHAFFVNSGCSAAAASEPAEPN